MPRAKISPERAQARGRIAGMTRTRPADDPELVAERRRLKELSLSEKIQAAVDSFPPLTDDQLTRLSGLLRPAGGDAA